MGYNESFVKRLIKIDIRILTKESIPIRTKRTQFGLKFSITFEDIDQRDKYRPLIVNKLKNTSYQDIWHHIGMRPPKSKKSIRKKILAREVLT